MAHYTSGAFHTVARNIYISFSLYLKAVARFTFVQIGGVIKEPCCATLNTFNETDGMYELTDEKVFGSSREFTRVGGRVAGRQVELQSGLILPETVSRTM